MKISVIPLYGFEFLHIQFLENHELYQKKHVLNYFFRVSISKIKETFFLFM